MSDSFLGYFRCPAECCSFDSPLKLGDTAGFFRFSKDLILFGRSAVPAQWDPSCELQDAATKVEISGSFVHLPFDVSEITDNLRFERYIARKPSTTTWKVVANTYYGVRPLLPPSIRKYFQKLYFRGWQDIKFPTWPIDDTVDRLFQTVMGYLVRARGREIPFIWFWPDAQLSCCILTHDVEHEAGLQFCLNLLRIDQEHGFKSSFQLVPEQRYSVPASLRKKIRDAGFELNVHDINHDGHLFTDYSEFLRRAGRINEYAKQWGVKGFRAGSMYRNLDWLSELNFDYDMSSPSAAHLEPQRGGCCSVMPFSVGSKIELPLTTTQDYSLYHILDCYSTDLWKQELGALAERNGLISFNVHPDYVIASKGRRIYLELLVMLKSMLVSKRVWQPFPEEAAQWWRQRSRLTLVKQGDEWNICGEGAHRARVAFAYLKDGQLRYRIGESRAVANSDPRRADATTTK